MAETSTGTQAVDRAAQLVSTVVHADAPLTFADLQEASGLAKSTTSRMLTALERTGLVERDDAGSYVAGRALLAVRRPPRPVGGAGPAGPPRDGADRRRHPRDRAPQRHPRREGRAGRPGRLPLPARHPRLDRDRGPRAHLRARQGLLRLGRAAGARTATLERLHRVDLADPEALRRDGIATRKRGWAVTHDELEVGLTGIAVPVQGPRGDVVAALGISGPTARLEDRLDELGRNLSSHAADLSGLLRGRTPIPVQQGGRGMSTPEEILQGLYDETLVGNAPRVLELTEEGLTHRHGAADAALRRAHPLARGGRRPLRARRLLRPGDADRRPRDGRRDGAAAAAARRDRRRRRSASS